MGVLDLFKAAAAYLDFIVDFLSFRGLDGYYLKDATSYVLLIYCVCGFGLARLVELAPLRKEVDDAAIFEEEYNFLEDKSRFKRISMVGESAFKPFVRSIVGNFGLHLFLVLSSGVFGVQLSSLKVTVNATLAFSSVYLPFAAFAEPFRTAGMKLVENAKSTRSDIRFGRLLLLVVSILYLGTEVYRLWAMARLHGIAYALIIIPALLYWVIILLALPFCFRIAKLVVKKPRRVDIGSGAK